MSSTQHSVAVGAYRLAWTETGSGDAVVAVHSSGLSSRQWRRLADRIAPRHRLIAPDLLGYGASSPWPAGRAFDVALDVIALEAMLARIDGPVHLVGHSYGGFLAAQVAMHQPARVRSLAVYEPVVVGALRGAGSADALAYYEAGAGVVGAAADGSEAWLERFVDFWNDAGAWAAQGEAARQGFRNVAAKLAPEVASLSTDRTPLDAYATLAMPVLAMHGSRSPIIGRRCAEVVAATVVNGSVVVIDGAGHMGPLTHAAVVNEAIAGHLGA